MTKKIESVEVVTTRTYDVSGFTKFRFTQDKTVQVRAEGQSEWVDASLLVKEQTFAQTHDSAGESSGMKPVKDTPPDPQPWKRTFPQWNEAPPWANYCTREPLDADHPFQLRGIWWERVPRYIATRGGWAAPGWSAPLEHTYAAPEGFDATEEVYKRPVYANESTFREARKAQEAFDAGKADSPKMELARGLGCITTATIALNALVDLLRVLHPDFTEEQVSHFPDTVRKLFIHKVQK